MKKDLAYVG